jgi:excisionase family DNA binding protein
METAALISEHELAHILSVTPRRLQARRLRGDIGLPFVKVGRSVRYRRADVEAYVEANLSSTLISEAPSPSTSD